MQADFVRVEVELKVFRVLQSVNVDACQTGDVQIGRETHLVQEGGTAFGIMVDVVERQLALRVGKVSEPFDLDAAWFGFKDRRHDEVGDFEAF